MISICGLFLSGTNLQIYFENGARVRYKTCRFKSFSGIYLKLFCLRVVFYYMKALRNNIILGTFLLLVSMMLGGCAALKGEEGAAPRRDYDPAADGYNYYDEMDDYYYEYMGY